MNATKIEINLELEIDADTVTGRASTADGQVREFSGWIGLMGLVDSLLDGARSGAPDPANQTTEERKDGNHD